MIIKKRIKWNMGHALSSPYSGQCSRIHGHNWEAWFEYEGPIGEDGMVVDTSVFKAMQKWVDENWDHRTLLRNDHWLLLHLARSLGEDSIESLGLAPCGFNPTSENIAKFLHKQACQLIQGISLLSLSVTVQETETIIVHFSGVDL